MLLLSDVREFSLKFACCVGENSFDDKLPMGMIEKRFVTLIFI